MQIDHKQLFGSIGKQKSVPVSFAARIKRWSLYLSNYQYELVYRSGTKNADALIRLWWPIATNQKINK